MNFSSDDLAALRTILREEIAAPGVTDRILTTAEAIAYTKHESLSAFYRWCSRWHLTSASAGRYARSRLDTALAREAEKRRAPKPAPRRPSPSKAAHRSSSRGVGHRSAA